MPKKICQILPLRIMLFCGGYQKQLDLKFPDLVIDGEKIELYDDKKCGLLNQNYNVMEGGCIEKQCWGWKKGQLLGTLVDINYEFRSTRIKHIFLLFCILSFRTLFSTILSLVILTKPKSMIFTFIVETWDIINSKLIDNNHLVLNLSILSFMVILYLCTVLCILNVKRSIKKIGLFTLTLIYALNPLLLRYMALLSVENNFTQSKQMSILCFLGIFGSFCCQFLFWLVSFNPHTKSENLLIKQRQITVIIKEMLLFVLIIVTSSIQHFGSNSQFRIFTTIIYNFLSLSTLYSLCSSFIYHHYITQTIFTLFTCLQTTASFSFLMSEVFQDQIIKNNLEIMVIVLGLFFYMGVKGFVGYRNQRSLVEVEQDQSLLQISLHVLGDCLENPNDNDGLWFAANAIKNQHAKSCEKLDCVCRKKVQDFQKNEEYERNLIKNRIKSILDLSNTNFSLTLSSCYLNLQYFQAFPDSLLILNRVKTSKQLNVFEQLQYSVFKNEIRQFLGRKRRDMNGAQIERVQKQDELIISLLKSMEIISHSKSTFWACLNKANPNLDAIDQAVFKATKEKKVVENRINEIVKLFAFSNSIMQLLCVYEVYVKLNSRLPKYLLQTQQKTAIIKVQKIKVLKSQQFKIDALMYEKYCVVFESQIQKENMGIILNVSKNITKVFGYGKQDIIGQNINEIMPKSMQKEHDNILQSWRQRASWSNVHKIRFILAMTKQNVCFESVIYLTILQRNDSINLFALFVKANQNSYMLVNDEGNIDGVGMDFIDIFGHKVAKLPLHSVCLEGEYIMKSLKNNKSEIMDINCFHVKGLEKQIDGYQHSKYQIINSGVQMKTELLDNIKTEDRCIKIKIEYKSYKMGTKSFVLIRLMETYESQKSEDNSLEDRIQNSNGDDMKSEEHNKNLTNLNIKQNQDRQRDLKDLDDSNDQAMSVSSSKNEDGIPWQKVLSILQDKAVNHSKLKSSKLIKFLAFILFLCILVITILFVQDKAQFYSMKAVRFNTARPSRFMFKTTSLALAYARVQNLDQIINGRMPGNIIYEIQRLLTEMAKLQASIYSKAAGLLNDVQGDNADIQWVGLDGKKLIVNFQQFYGNYLAAAKKIRETYVKNQTMAKEKMLILNNYENVKPYADINIKLISNEIISGFGDMMVIQILRIVFVICSLFLIAFSLWRSKNIESEQQKKVYKVILAISDLNCQNCGIYYKNIWHTIKKCQTYAKNKQNEAQTILKAIVEQQKLEVFLNSLFIYRDQIEKRRESKIVKKSVSKIKILVILVVLAFLGQVAYSAHYEINFLIRNQYFYEYYNHFIENENQNFYRFQLIKQVMFQNSTLSKQQVESYFHSSQLFSENNQQSTKNFLDLFENLKKVSTPNANLNKYAISSLNLCQQLLSMDPRLFVSMCKGNYSFPYDRLQFVETNSIIEQNFKQIIYSFSQGVIQSQENFKKIRIVEQLLTMKLTYIYGFSLTLSLWAVVVYTTNQYYNQDMRMILASMFILLGIVSCVLIKKMNQSMKDSFWIILILPEIVLRRTKRAMKFIQDLLK